MSNVNTKKISIWVLIAIIIAIGIKFIGGTHRLETKPPSRDSLSTQDEQLPCTKDSLNFITDEFYIKVPCNRVPGMTGYTTSIGDALLLIKAFNGDNPMVFDRYNISKNGTPVDTTAINIRDTDYLQSSSIPADTCVVSIRVELFWDPNNNQASSNTLVYYLKDHASDRHLENNYKNFSSRYNTNTSSCGTDTTTLAYYVCLDGLAHHEADHTLIRKIDLCE